MKHCNTCNTTKSKEDFHKRAASKDGLSAKCKNCDYLSKRDWKNSNPERYKESNRINHEKNREKNNERSREWRKENPEAAKRVVRRWFKENKEKAGLLAAGHRARKIGATPSWLTKEHKEEIVKLILERDKRTKDTGKPHHLDHIVPLRGKTVCGLHVPWNLEVLDNSSNSIKGNRIWPDMW